MRPETQRYGLGIDTGGTFTDAVVLGPAQRVLASAKQLTTRFDLAVGIGHVLDQLPREALAQVDWVSLSTTLTTNSAVEGTGAPVCVLLAGYDEAQIQASGLVELLGSGCIEALDGGHDAHGKALAPLDEARARAAIARHAPKVSAFAISARFSVRNPEHEYQLRQWVREICQRPVTCGHELASDLGAPRRAMTAALNARMVSHIQRLIDAVQHALQQRGIEAPLMLVKGDGSLINVPTALQNPVSTVLSGPAASVLGACALAGVRDAVVADMGGTTTDIAIVRNGQAALSSNGARIGPWSPMVEASQVYANGLGGDSEVRFSGGEGIAIGPRRVLPLSLLAHQHPQVLEVLRRQHTEAPHASQMRFVQRLHAEATQLAQLSADELAAWHALAQGPIDMERSNIEHRQCSRALARLERKGLAIYSGFTPSDAAHVLGQASHWSSEAAHFAAIIWARQMRHLYGWGTWPQGDAKAPAQTVLDHVVRHICHTLIEAGLHDSGLASTQHTPALSALLADMAMGAASGPATFALQFAPQLPLVAVGAAAASYYPNVAQRLQMPLLIPAHAEVANAVGAALGQVRQRARITVSHAVRGLYRVFAPSGPQDFTTLPSAIAYAQTEASVLARAQALAAGAQHCEVQLEPVPHALHNDIDGDLFLECHVGATAVGPPHTRSSQAANR